MLICLRTSTHYLKILCAACLIELFLISACDQFEGFLLCRKCGFELAKAQDLFSMPSHLAVGVRNDTIAKNQKVYIQLFKNPHGNYFEVITSRTADAETDNVNFGSDSWFPGYVWSIAKCPRCGTHVGWVFTAAKAAFEKAESQISSFVGIILGQVMHEEEVNSLIITPKLYHS
ncbi:protein cereblon [Plakobranchus ocellatus]|uniref:Protein cereblon n=1 Tax=Plakobranchus ocellatus TaxID=259542 RepID=A0AAV3Z9H0_9GAST|nr:protein cereblon [Plakobranchus ocellatus]